MSKEKKITNPIKIDKSDQELDLTLRPSKLSQYIGQEKVKESIAIFTQAAKNRGDALEHVLIYGPPGLGKTTLAHIIANEMSSNIKVTSGPAIERAGDLASILTNLSDGDILFIDEVHRLNKVVEEVLYPAMEDYALDLVVGKGPSAKTLRLDLPKFTLVGATTRIAALSSPMRDRFGIIHNLDFYSTKEIEQIIKRAARILEIKIDQSGIVAIAKRSRATPRIANRLLKRTRDFAQVKSNGIVSANVAKDALKLLEIDHQGLDKTDQKILAAIIHKFSGGPVGLETLAAATSEDIDTICDVYEPYLMKIGFLERTPRGRKATKHAYLHLGIKPKEDHQEKLL